jgi:DNA-binding IclR family transcriptional regulator
MPFPFDMIDTAMPRKDNIHLGELPETHETALADVNGGTMTKDQSTAQYIVEVVERAVIVLQAVASSPGLGVSEIARLCNDGKARTYRLLCTLEKRALVSRDDGGTTYQLGHAAVVLGAAASAQFNLTRLAQPVLDDLGRELNETVKLRIRDGLEIIGVAKWEPDREVRCHAQIGRRHPLYSDPGKLLLAYSPDEIQSKVLSELPGGVPNLSANVLAQSLAQIRADGIHITSGDTRTPSDAISLTVPIFNGERAIVAAMVAAIPKSRLDAARREVVSSALLRHAHMLSASLGYQ